MGSKTKTWTTAASMSLLAFAVYSKEQGYDDFLQRVSQHLQPFVQGKIVTDAAVTAQLSRLSIKLHTSAVRLRHGDMEAIDANAAYLMNEEKESLQDELEKLFRPGVPPSVSRNPVEPLERHQNAKSDNVMVENSMLAECSTVAPSGLEAPPHRRTKRLRTSQPLLESLPIRQLGVQDSSPHVHSGLTRDADKITLQREIENLRKEKRILEQLSTQTQTRNDELHEQLIGLNNSHEKLEVEHAATRRAMDDLRRFLAQRRCNKPHGQGQDDKVMEQVQPTVCSHDADRINELYDDLLSPMVLARNGTSVLASISRHEVLKEWQSCQNRLKSLSFGTLWGRGAIKPETIAPGFFSFLSKLYGQTEKVSIHEPSSCLPLIENPNKRNILRSYAMDNLCERVFQRSDFHDYDKTKCRMLEKYRLLIAGTTGGFQTLQTLDAAAMKDLLSESDGFLRKRIIEEEADKITKKVDADLAPFFMDELSIDTVSTRQNMFRECARRMIALKFELLLADKEYEIHFVNAGSLFDSSTMDAVSYDGSVVKGGPQSIVQFCIYPALVQHDSTAVANANLKDFSAMLLCNKSFYPTNSLRQNAQVIARATVLLA